MEVVVDINPFSSSNCAYEAVKTGIKFAEQRPVATGIVLGAVAIGTGGAALAIEAARRLAL